MLLTKQQKYLLAVLEKLGCAEQRQLAALLTKMFSATLRFENKFNSWKIILIPSFVESLRSFI